MLTRANSDNVGFRPVVKLFAVSPNPTHAPHAEISFYNSERNYCGVNNVRTNIMV